MLGIILAGGAVFSLIATDGQIGRFLDFGTDDYNVAGNEGRLYFWRQGMVWMIKRPWGYGIRNFGTYFGWLNGPDRAAHSMWVQYGMELGVAGLAAIVILCRFLIKRIRANRLQALAMSHTAGKLAMSEATLAGHVLAMLAATLVTGSFLSNAYYPLTYMALGLAAATTLGYPLRPTAAVPATESGATKPNAPPRIGRRQSFSAR
jgi:O-antigen ligase